MHKVDESVQYIIDNVHLANPPQSLLNAINALNQEELLALYEQGVVEQLHDKLAFYFNCLIQQENKHSLFIHLITHCASIDAALMQNILSKLPSSNLLALVSNLLTQSRNEAAEYTANLYQVLYFLLQNLNTTLKTDKLILAWPEQEKGMALSHALLGSIECISEFAKSRASWLTWTPAAKVNESHIGLLLSYPPQNSEQIIPEVLVWLVIFQENPERLVLLFNKLAQISKSAPQETNFSHIKRSFWQLLSPEIVYDEGSFFSKLQSLTQHLTAQTSALIRNNKDLCSSYQQAQIVAYTKENVLHLFSAAQIQELLLHSLQDKACTNWGKAALWLNAQEEEAQYVWLKQLITKSRNVVFNQQLYHFIYSLGQFSKFRDCCQESELAYFLLHAKEKDFSDWLTYLTQRHAQQALNIDAIASELLHHPKKITVLLQQHTLINPPLIATLLLKAPLLATLHDYINSQDKTWLHSLFLTLNTQIQMGAPSLDALSVINDLITAKQNSWCDGQPEDQQLICDYLNGLLHYSMPLRDATSQEQVQKELFLTLDIFLHLNEQWRNYLFQQAFMRELFSYFLPQNPSWNAEYIARHPLTPLCLISEIKSLGLIDEQKEQLHLFIVHLLLHTPPGVSSEQFLVLFGLLKNEQQHQLAQSILLLPDLKKTQYDTIHQLIAQLSAEEQYSFLNQIPNQQVLHELLFPNNVHALSALQWKKILEHISLNHILTFINNEHIAPKTRSARFASLLDYIGLDATQWSKEQKLCLYQQSMLLLPHAPELIGSLLALCSWDDLLVLLNAYPLQRFTLVRAAMQHGGYEEELIKSSAQQQDFLTQLLSYNFPIQQLIELTKQVPAQNRTIHSLITLCFLLHEESVNALNGPSHLNALNNTKSYHASRLNNLLGYINPKFLNNERISTLPQETCLALLCCIPHFHRWTDQQIQSVVNKLPRAKSLGYWLNNYYNMPHANYMLAHFLTIAKDYIYKEIEQLSIFHKRALIKKIIEQIELFPDAYQLIEQADEERHLIQAIKKYNHGTNTPILIHLIQHLVQKLHVQGHVFSLTATTLLIPLQKDTVFSKQHMAMAYLINHYLKINAQAGTVDLFYKQEKPDIERMKQLILLRPQYPQKEKGLNDHLLISILQTKEEKNIFSSVKVDHLLDMMTAKKITQISALDYFLLYYKGDNETLAALLHEYVRAHAQQSPCTTTHKKALHHIATFMTRTELSANIQNTIYQVLLHYPTLYDAHISSCLFLFDATKTIQHFGMQGTLNGYQQVIDMCEMALEKLDSVRHSKAIYDAKTALREAQIELAYKQNKSFFSTIIYFITRCWVYGWTGFFIPNEPTYVLSATQNNPDQAKKTILKKRERSFYVPQNVLTFIHELSHYITVEKLDELLLLLEACDYKKASEEELSIRIALHELIPQIKNQGISNFLFTEWFSMHHHVFEDNYIHLIEYLLNTRSVLETQIILGEQHKELKIIPQILRELISSTDWLQQTNKEKPQVNNWQWPNLFSFFQNPSPQLITTSSSSPSVQAGRN